MGVFPHSCLLPVNALCITERYYVVAYKTLSLWLVHALSGSIYLDYGHMNTVSVNVRCVVTVDLWTAIGVIYPWTAWVAERS